MINVSSSGMKELFYLTTHSTHYIYVYMGSDIWYITIQKVREETCCHYIGYIQDSTYHGLSYTRHLTLAGSRNNTIYRRSTTELHHFLWNEK